ncbi:carboxymuconolactone decarboxylase family protein [Mesobacillus zeae]|uniref:Carboxymuconolactone decarboxylase family protein n=1 Tax=Mesobacillus zeae TaxID=1917180 RepID=A0A398B9P3_9BACI|nr:carboxymuconolactone decarboxylase family protein [Mesobacillus zeae]RID86254.1 carboxymuconolactone decarboxylase family protein [Mesobacillus zeae]
MESQYSALNGTEATLHDYKQGLGLFTQKMPDIARHYNAFTEACFKEGSVTMKEKHLIALGIALHAQDEYCIVYHIKGCIDNGATEEQIMETVGVAAALGGGAAMSQAVTLVQEAVSDLSQRH